jgi:hypothetical protein
MKSVLFLSLGLLCSVRIRAQTNNSPYSVVAIGDLEDGFLNRTTGMANTGIAYRTNRNLIINNPAALSALDNQFFVGETSIRAEYIGYYGSPVDPTANNSFDITYHRFALGTKLFKHWGSSVGLTPFSSENYEFNGPQPILGTIGETTNAYYQGYGGINKVYWANAYEFFHHLSVGVDMSYLFGSINQKSILQNSTSYVSSNANTNYNSFYFTYGLQYYTPVGKHWNFALGATFANKTELFPYYTYTVLAIDSSVLYNFPQQQTSFYTPVSYGIGISLSKNNKYSFLADYKYQGWSALNYSGFHYALQDTRRYSVGFEISKKRTIYSTVIESSFLQAGLFYGNTYVNVYGQPINDMGASLGFGVNSLRSPLSYAVTLQYGIRGTQSNNLIEERYAKITVMVSFRDLWFTRGRVVQ